MQAKVYNQKGDEVGKVNLPESAFGVAWSPALVFQVVDSAMANLRRGTAHSKDRSEVRGGGRKPWRQKGTGRARHGSNRSPIWRGGGVTFGPRKEKDYSKKINKKMRRKAFVSALSKKFEDGELIFVDNFSIPKPKTAEALSSLKSLSKIAGAETLLSKKKNSALVATLDKNQTVEKSFNNFSNISVMEVRNLSAYDILKYKLLVISGGQGAVDMISNKTSKKDSVKIKPASKVTKKPSVKKPKKPTEVEKKKVAVKKSKKTIKASAKK